MASTDGSQGFRKLTRKFDKVSRGGERAREKLRCFEASAFQRRDVHRKVYRDQCCWKMSLKLGPEERGKGSSEIEDRRAVLQTRGAEQRELRHRPIFPHSSKPSSESFFPSTLIATVFRACSNIWVRIVFACHVFFVENVAKWKQIFYRCTRILLGDSEEY